MTEASFYERVGGEPFFRALCDDFFAQVPSNPLLSEMYPPSVIDGANERLRLFLIQYWGGPTTYSDQRGHPRLRARHLPFHIDEAARDAWMELMMNSVAKREMTPELHDELVTYLTQVAHFLVNNEQRQSNA